MAYGLGVIAVALSLQEAITSPEADQVMDEVRTGVNEALATDEQYGDELEATEFYVPLIVDEQLMAKDGKTPIADMTENGLVCAQKTAEADERFSPQLTRCEWEHALSLLANAMMGRKTPFDTIIAVSPFVEEAVEESGDAFWQKVGYVPRSRRGFVWFWHVNEDGTPLAGTLSFDGSSKARLREVFAEELGINVPEELRTDGWIQYAYTGTLSEDAAKELAIRVRDKANDPRYQKTANTATLTDQNEPTIRRVVNESYAPVCESLVRRRQTAETIQVVDQLARNAHYFDERYAGPLRRLQANRELFTHDDWMIMHDLLVYSTVEMMRALHVEATMPRPGPNRKARNDGHFLAVELQTANSAIFQTMLGDFGGDGARNNRIYSACGTALDPGRKQKNDGPQSAAGEQAASNADEGPSVKKFMSCPFCNTLLFDDPCARFLRCGDCRAKVKDGQVTSTGNGGTKARLAKHWAEERVRAAERRKSLEAARARRVNRALGRAGTRPGQTGPRVHAGRRLALAALTS
ncbi:MAG TPA: hypothetical protein VLE99_00410 [Candidatus Saccharimonadales bacterium]|nr:hypothetical protein [Candidatus Saccharimonadales bacterium]